MAQEIAHKRILIVCQHFWPESFRINDIADYFVEQGCEVDVLCGLPNYPKGEFMDGYGYLGKRHEVHNGVRIDRVLEIKRGNNSSLRIFLNYISFPFFSLFHIPKLLWRKYDHIFMYETSPVMMTLAGIILGKIKKTPTTMYVLDLWPENLYSVIPIKNRFLDRLLTNHSHWYYKKTDKLIALSDQMSRQLLKITRKSKNAIITLPQACEKIYEVQKSDKKLRSRFANTFNVVFTGNISPAQSFETMIGAAQILKERGYTDIRWVIVGDGMSRRDVEKQATEKGLPDIFVFEGHHPIGDMPKYADIADVLVGCLVKSNFLEATIPAKVMSYIALGKPIVLAMDGEVRTLINATIRCGYVGATNDMSGLANNIEKVHRLSTLERSELGQRAREYHFSNFERNIVLEKLFKFIMS